MQYNHRRSFQSTRLSVIVISTQYTPYMMHHCYLETMSYLWKISSGFLLHFRQVHPAYCIFLLFWDIFMSQVLASRDPACFFVFLWTAAFSRTKPMSSNYASKI